MGHIVQAPDSEGSGAFHERVRRNFKYVPHSVVLAADGS